MVRVSGTLYLHRTLPRAVHLVAGRTRVHMIKRAFDIIFTAFCLILAGPVIAAAALVFELEGCGLVFHRSPRLARGGRVFSLLRLRTIIGAPPGTSPDEQPTPVGRFIRTYSLDDLPSLFHVLRGDLRLL
jgi:lipopolysaccharide/colanic/teichoic acid biosynthesis glycosyltransferase